MKRKLLLASVALLGLCGAQTANATLPLREAASRADRFTKQPVKWGALRHSSDPEVRRAHRPAAELSPRVNAAENSLGVYGYITMSENWDFMPQWVELTNDGYSVCWADQDYWLQGEVKLDIGWVRDGKLCGYATKLFMGQQLIGYYYKEFDMETGLSTLTKEMDFNNSSLFMTAAYSPDEDLVFGFGIDAEGGAMLLKAPGSDPTNIQVARDLRQGPNDAVLQSICWNSADARFVGINYSGELVALDLEGNVTTLHEYIEVPLFTPYYTGLCYDATNRVYYWNITDEHSSYIYTVDPATAEGTMVSKFDENEIFSCLWCPSKVVATDAPGRITIKDVSFEGAALSGSVTIELPSLLTNGEEITAPLFWTATLDGEKYKFGQAAPGSEVTVQYESLAEGMHTFSFYATCGDLDGADVETSLYVGKDAPAMPQNVVFTTTEVKWDAVTTGAHAGYVDPSQIRYEVFVDGEFAGSTSATSLPLTQIDESGTISAHQATVTAIYENRRSEPGVSNRIAYGAPMQLPVQFRPTAEEFLLMTTEDANGDGYGWHYVGEVTDPDFPCLDSDYSHSLTEPADDWLFLPPVALDDAEAFYNFSFYAKGRMTVLQPDEFFEVYIGKQPIASEMTQLLIPRTQAIFGFYDYEKYFRVPEAGTYYIGIHAVSDPAMFGVRIRDLHLYKSDIQAESPNVPTKASATPATGGALNADVTFTLPLATVDGVAYPAGTELRAVVTGDTEVSATGAPGETLTVNVRTVQGDNRIRITPWCGQAIGLPIDVTVYTGIDVPTAPPSLSSETDEDNINMTLNWSEPTEGEHKGFLDPSKISYQLHAFNQMFGWIPFDAVGEGVTTYNFSGEEEDFDGGLVYVRLGVSSQNAAGSSKFLTATGGVLGVPYTLPFEEKFDAPDGALVGPWITVGGSDVSWGFADLADISYDWANLSGGALVGMPADRNVTSTIAFPKFSTKIAEDNVATFSLRLWTGAGCPAAMRLYGLSAGMERVLIATIPVSRGWETFTYTLPASLQQRGWVQMMLECDFLKTDQLCVVDEFTVTQESGVSALENDVDGRIYATGGVVKFENLEGRVAEIYTTDGRRVASYTIPASEFEVKMPVGVYLVRCGGLSCKFIGK